MNNDRLRRIEKLDSMSIREFFERGSCDVVNDVDGLERVVPLEGDEELEFYAQKVEELLPDFWSILCQKMYMGISSKVLDLFREYQKIWKQKGKDGDLDAFMGLMKDLLKKYPGLLLITEENKSFFQKYELSGLQKELFNSPHFCKAIHAIKSQFFSEIVGLYIHHISQAKFFLEAIAYSPRFASAYKSFALLDIMNERELKAFFLILYMYPQTNIHKGLTDYLYERLRLGNK